jgi:hypothetical protein
MKGQGRTVVRSIALAAIYLGLYFSVTYAIRVEAAQSTAKLFHNERLKYTVLPEHPMEGTEYVVVATGILLPESSSSDKDLVFPEQMRITCTRNSLYPEHKQGECAVITEALGVMSGIVMINDPDEDQYEITKWDSEGLTASYTDDFRSKCQMHVLTIAFKSGIVSDSDIPTRKKGCEIFTETNSYRLKPGFYYVDTTPNNDGDKPLAGESK